MANELRVSISADTSGLEAGLTKATAQVSASAQQMKEAQKAAAEAARNYAETLEALNTVASGTGPGQAAAAAEIALTKNAADQAAAAVERLTAAKLRSSNAWNQEMAAANRTAEAEAEAARAEELAALKADILARSNENLAVTQDQVAASGTKVTGSLYAAQGAGALLAGRIPIRAMERFLASSEAVSAALRVAFPVIGAIAIGEVLGEMVKHAYDLYEKFIDISSVDDKLIADFKKMRDSDLFDVHSIETAAQRLGEAQKNAANLRQTAQELHNLGFKDLVGDILGGNQVAAAGALANLLTAKKLADESGKQTENAIRLSLIEIRQQHELALAGIERAHAADAQLPKEQQITAEHAKQLAIIRENQGFERKEERALGNTSPGNAGAEMAAEQIGIANARESVQIFEQQLKFKNAIAQAEIEVAHAGDSELPPAQQITAELEKQLALHLQAQAASRSGLVNEDRRVRQLQDAASVEKSNADLSRLVHEELDQTFTLEMKDQDEARRQESENQKKAAEDFRQARSEQIALAKEAASATIKAAEEEYQFAQRQIQFQVQLGIISAKVAEQRLLAAQRLKETETVGALKQEQQIFDPNLSAKELQEWLQLQHRMTQETQKGALQREQIVQQESLKIIKIYQRMAQEFNQDFTRSFNSWITGSETASHAFAKMLGEMELQLIDFVAMWALKKAEMWALDKALEISGHAAHKAIETTSNVATVTGDAGVAFAGTMAYYSAINPPAAPALASAAYATTLAGGLTAQAFEMGGIIAGTAGAPVPIIGHAGERVLSQSQTQNFETLVNNRSSSTSSSRVVNMGGFTQNINSPKASPRQLAAATQNALRRGLLRSS